MKKLILVVPCYNEEEVLEETTNELNKLFDNLFEKSKISKESFIMYVNDGSKDKTWNLIENLTKQYKWINGLNLAGNVGHQNALYAGLMYIKDQCDMAISIDADLQDDITVIEEMIDEYNKGNDIVYGVRNNRSTDSYFKRITAQSFYKIMNYMGVKTVYNHADFRLMSKRAIQQLAKYKERNLFLRGLIPLIGYSTTSVYYSRKERMAGESKYPLKKMLSFAFEGITSFSVKPISLIIILGMLTTLGSILMMFYSIVQYFLGETISGWTSLIVSLWFLGGVQLISIGTIGKYIGKIYIEVKQRPRYNIEKFLKRTENDREDN